MPHADARVPLINPTAEEAFWRTHFRDEAFYRDGLAFDDYSPAFRVGYTGPVRREGRLEELDARLRDDWAMVRGRSRLSWGEAWAAIEAAWHHAVGEELAAA